SAYAPLLKAAAQQTASRVSRSSRTSLKMVRGAPDRGQPNTCGYFLRVPARFRDPADRDRLVERLRGTFAPDRRALSNPIAIACLRLVTRRPVLPDRSVPRFRSLIA